MCKMSSGIWLCDWDKAPKHLQRYIYTGRIFCFEFDESTYCFGRIMAKMLVGYIAEIFDYTSPLPQITEDIIRSAKRIDVLVLDTVNLFERNKKHTWRIIGNDHDYKDPDPESVSEICYRIGTELRKVDFFGNISEISEKESNAIPSLIPLNEDEVKEKIAPKIGKTFTRKTARKKPKAEIEIWGWDKKPRTMLRYLDPGQIFCFQFDENKYCFGRLMTHCAVGHIAEFFDFISSLPEITAERIKKSKRTEIAILDSYSLFDRKTEGEWRIIGICNNYIPTDVENIIFYFGVGDVLTLIDFFYRMKSVPKDEAMKFPPQSPFGDYLIKKLLADKIK